MSDTNIPVPGVADGAVRVQTSSKLKYTYVVPAASRSFPGDPESITMSPLTMDQMNETAKISEASGSSMSYELLKRSLVAVNKRPLSVADAESEKALAGFSPKVRQHLLEAYADIHNPKEEDSKGFLSSRLVEV